jgi:uncharacterized RDD family membrane protein YckC
LGIVIVGLLLLLSAVMGYDGRAARLEEISEKYETEYSVDFDISESDFEKLTEDEKAQYKLAMEAFSKDGEANYVYSVLVNLTFAMITFSILIAFLLLELLVPLLFGNGQTLGKKVFGIAVMREDGVKISPMILFVRAILGKYTVETMIPVLVILMIYWDMLGILGTVLLFALLIFQIILLLSTRERKVIHDILSHTVTVDYASQKIFDTPEAMIEYKKRLHQ